MPKLGKVPVPTLIVVSQPTELIVTSGEPTWEKIPSTGLSFISNTASHVFRLDSDKGIYVLISGRWFRSGAFAGPWAYVAPEKLPKDFAAIPDESPQENVKASVPGTRQAKEAAIASSIPQTTKVERAKASMEPAPAFDGGPKLAAIEGTPLSYVVNCPTPVIKVDEKTWYACQNGVWFVATSATGPWTVADKVPAVIYTIPASSPVHYVTYVKVYRTDPTYVWVGYTPGYYGAMVTDPGVVVYGTGYTYVPYVSTTVYVSYPVTYGYATNMCWTPWAGWAFGFGVGFAWSAGYHYWAGCPAAPYWGAYWGPMYGWGYSAYGGVAAWGAYGWAGTSGNIYSHAGPWHGVSRVSGGYNAWTGNRWASQYGRAYNSRPARAQPANAARSATFIPAIMPSVRAASRATMPLALRPSASAEPPATLTPGGKSAAGAGRSTTRTPARPRTSPGSARRAAVARLRSVTTWSPEKMGRSTRVIPTASGSRALTLRRARHPRVKPRTLAAERGHQQRATISARPDVLRRQPTIGRNISPTIAKSAHAARGRSGPRVSNPTGPRMVVAVDIVEEGAAAVGKSNARFDA